MGTRGAIGFRIDQTDKLFYNHHDSYPDYLGDKMVKWCKANTGKWPRIYDQAKALVQVSHDDKPTKEQKARAYELNAVDLTVSKQSDDDFYCLTRKTQGDLDAILMLGFVITDSGFVKDSLFCEYAYIVNLDTMELEFYQGFNKDREADGRYARLDDGENVEYCGVKLVGTAPLDAIPDDWQAKFYPPEADDD